MLISSGKTVRLVQTTVNAISGSILFISDPEEIFKTIAYLEGLNGAYTDCILLQFSEEAAVKSLFQKKSDFCIPQDIPFARHTTCRFYGPTMGILNIFKSSCRLFIQHLIVNRQK